MSRTRSAGESMIAGMQDALAYAQGDSSRGDAHRLRVPQKIDVKAIRQRLGLTQLDFAQRYGFALRSIQNWEQGRRQPDSPTRLLLLVIDREPEAVERALAG